MARGRNPGEPSDDAPSSDSSFPPAPTLALSSGAWYDEARLCLRFPLGWRLYRADPADAPELSDAQIVEAIARPIGTEPLRRLAAGKKSAVIAVDDLTRPTPAHRFVSKLITELNAGGIPVEHIRIVMGTAAHRPMSREEIVKKLGADVSRRVHVVVHDFLGSDVRYVGWVDGGPVYLNRHLLDADLKICVGSAIPHGEAGFGGGAKMVVPGLAGRATIAHFHGALPARKTGRLESGERMLDRRAWAERVARHIGVQLTACAVVNSRRELAGLYLGDIVEAHRVAAGHASRIGRTVVPQFVADRADVVVVNAYPLDTDPIQMGKSLALARGTSAKLTVVINAASDGIFFHGMGMGSGVSYKRLLKNLTGWITDPASVVIWMRSMICARRSPTLALRTCYFALNHLPYRAFEQKEKHRNSPPSQGRNVLNPDPLIFSKAFPAWGVSRKYPYGQLYLDWKNLCLELERRSSGGLALVFPCAPLQLLEIGEDPAFSKDSLRA